MGKEEYAEKRLLEGLGNPLATQIVYAKNLHHLADQFIGRLPKSAKAQRAPLARLRDGLAAQLKSVEERAINLRAVAGLSGYEQSVVEKISEACAAPLAAPSGWHGPTALIHHLPDRLSEWMKQRAESPEQVEETGLHDMMKEAAFAFVSSTDIYDALRVPSGEGEEKESFGRAHNPNPAYPPGSYVRINSTDKLYYYNDGRVRRHFEVDSYNALVAESYLEEEGQSFYSVVFDVTAMRLMPRDYIIEEVSSFELLEFVEEELLSAERRRRSPHLTDILGVARELRYTQGLSSLDSQQQQDRLERILLQQADQTDEQNWLEHLKEHLPLPHTLYARGELDEWQAGEKVQLLGYLGYSHQYGLIVHAQSGKDHRYVPLAELRAEEGPLQELLDDYYAWFEHIL